MRRASGERAASPHLHEDRPASRALIVAGAPSGRSDERDYHLKRAGEEHERALAAPSPGIAALHLELSRLHDAATGRKGFEPGLPARVIGEASGTAGLTRIRCGTGAIVQAAPPGGGPG